MRRFSASALLLLAMCATIAAQGVPEKGSRELGVWAGGGPSVAGGTSGVGVWNVGLRYGWVLTDAHGPGPLRGRLEYAVDAIPVYVVMESGASYGGGFDPFVLKWNFDSRRRVVPFVELAGGTLFSSGNVPRRSPTNVNFTSQAAAGLQIIGHYANAVLAVRYAHISNAGLASPNPGINTVQFQLGVNGFMAPHRRH